MTKQLYEQLQDEKALPCWCLRVPFDKLKSTFNPDLIDFDKGWGGYITLIDAPDHKIKTLYLTGELSVQSHNHRREVWTLIKGRAKILLGRVPENIRKGVMESGLSYSKELSQQIEQMLKNMTITHFTEPAQQKIIYENELHTAVNINRDGYTAISEIALGTADEQDILRFYDKTGRVRILSANQGRSILDMLDTPPPEETIGVHING